MWSADPEEQELLETVGIAGDMPALDGADGWSFSVSNTGGNKIDAYLQRKAGYTPTTDPDTGVTTGTMRIELTNTAPADGLPDVRHRQPDRQAERHEQPVRVAVQPARARPGHRRRHRRRRHRGHRGRLERLPVLVDIPAGATAARSRPRCPARSPTPSEVVTWTQPMSDQLQPL